MRKSASGHRYRGRQPTAPPSWVGAADLAVRHKVDVAWGRFDAEDFAGHEKFVDEVWKWREEYGGTTSEHPIAEPVNEQSA